MSRRGRRRVKQEAQVTIAPQRIWRPRELRIAEGFAKYLEEEGLELEAVEVLEEDARGIPTKCNLRLRPADPEDIEAAKECARVREAEARAWEAEVFDKPCPCESGESFGRCHGKGGNVGARRSRLLIDGGTGYGSLGGEADDILQELSAAGSDEVLFPVPSESDLDDAEEIIRTMRDTPATRLALARLRAARGRK